MDMLMSHQGGQMQQQSQHNPHQQPQGHFQGQGTNNGGQGDLQSIYCGYCSANLSFPRGSMCIKCPQCQGTQNPNTQQQSVCIGCGTLLAHPSNSLYIQCPKCFITMNARKNRANVSIQQGSINGHGIGGSGSQINGSHGVDPYIHYNTDVKPVKKKKDPNAPKAASNAYMIFCKQRRSQLKLDNPNLAFGKIGAKLGEIWRNLSAEEKQPYEERAAADRERYRKDMESYKAGEDISSSSSVRSPSVVDSTLSPSDSQHSSSFANLQDQEKLTLTHQIQAPEENINLSHSMNKDCDASNKIQNLETSALSSHNAHQDDKVITSQSSAQTNSIVGKRPRSPIDTDDCSEPLRSRNKHDNQEDIIQHTHQGAINMGKSEPTDNKDETDSSIKANDNGFNTESIAFHEHNNTDQQGDDNNAHVNSENMIELRPNPDIFGEVPSNLTRSSTLPIDLDDVGVLQRDSVEEISEVANLMDNTTDYV